MALPLKLKEICDAKLPFHPLELSVVIAREHQAWYTSSIQSARNFYWRAYSRQLSQLHNWPDDSILQLADSTTRVVERLADPTQEQAYQSKGLVVGYVQSGKTAHFTGVIAKAADAGYKLILVLAGTLDVLRSQTQRRIDKDMIGRELLGSDYEEDTDWHDFVAHGNHPSALGSFDWLPLTGPEVDYMRLRKEMGSLAFERTNKLGRCGIPIICTAHAAGSRS